MFEIKKILQVISYLLSLNNGKMNFLKLMKELYLIDRESIAERDTSITGDVYYSLPHGPVLSATKNLLDDLKSDDIDESNPLKDFLQFIKNPKYNRIYDIVLEKAPEYDLLSEKDKEYIEKISKQFKNYSAKDIEQYTHRLPEWIDPNGSNVKIRFQDIMRALGKSEEEILIAKQEYEQITNLNKYISETARGF
ncbi:MAG: SocA family protein [Campylobacteraceae bacterium]|jgi:uncharacterized phage-associated protein|nr:SocA family protein [Campylobacteraceae bacterium]